MGSLKLYGMRSAYDEVMAAGIKRQHEPPRIVGDLLQSEIAEKQARSIRYQMTVAKLPLAKDIEEFDFTHQSTLRLTTFGSLLSPDFVTEGHSVILEGKPGRGKTHLAIALAFDPASDQAAPEVVAKGEDALAKRMAARN